MSKKESRWATSYPRCTSCTHELLLFLSPLPVSPPHATQSSGIFQPHPNTVLRAHRGRDPRADQRRLPGGRSTETQHFQVEGACGHGQLCLVRTGSFSVLGLLL